VNNLRWCEALADTWCDTQSTQLNTPLPNVTSR